MLEPEHYLALWSSNLVELLLEPADVALRFQDGRLISMLRPQEQGLLDEVSVDQWGSLTLTGEMLSADMGAWLSGLDRGAGNGLASRLALMGLLLLLVAGAGAWGMALARSAPKTFPVALRTVLAIVPAASVALTTSESLLPWLHGAGALSAGLVAILTGIAILLHAREAGRLFR